MAKVGLHEADCQAIEVYESLVRADDRDPPDLVISGEYGVDSLYLSSA
jgi:hypothetical protein